MNEPSSLTTTTFADFMYAVVVGVAFSDIHVFGHTATAQSVFITFLLLMMVLEDFYLYQTQVKPYTNIFKFQGFWSFCFEVSILLAWYIAFAGRLEARSESLFALAVFFFLKWAASAKHLLNAPKNWVIHRDHLFWITIIASVAIAMKHIPSVVQVCRATFAADWVLVAAAWILQTITWWYIVAHHKE
jgi:hypothetical protein